MKRFILFFCFLGLLTSLSAQTNQSFTLKAGQSLSEVLPDDQIYSYPDFAEGTVHYSDGTTSTANFNYNVVLAKMEFINSRKDTLVITNSQVIDSIVVSNDTYFVSEDKYFRKLAGKENLFVFEREYLKLSDVKSPGAYGTSSSTASTVGISQYTFQDREQFQNFKIDKDLVYSIHVDHFFKGDENEFYAPRKKKLLNSFPEHSKTIKEFIKSHSTKFNDGDDLIALTEFINTLEIP